MRGSDPSLLAQHRYYPFTYHRMTSMKKPRSLFDLPGMLRRFRLCASPSISPVFSLIGLPYLLFIATQFHVGEGFAEGPKSKNSQGVRWEPWGDAAFTRAKSQKKLVLLNLKAEWCHWCHVMDSDTYSSKKVQDILEAFYVTVEEQQDANPALSAHYRDYGWPATVVFSASGEELKIFSGYVEAEEFAAQLSRLVKDPRPLKREVVNELSSESAGEEGILLTLRKRYLNSLDSIKGGLKTSHKFLDPDSVEYAIRRAVMGEQNDREWLLLTLSANQALIDPTWGGFYQYSTGRDWKKPHFEKLLTSQVTNIKSYLLGFAALGGEVRNLEIAEATHEYLNQFLRGNEGSYYVSQSADISGVVDNKEYFLLPDQERRAQGLPKVDSNEYAREAALGMEALLFLYAHTSTSSYLSEARRVGEWLIRNRIGADGTVARGMVSLPDGKGSSDHYLADAIPVARSFLKMTAITGEPKWFDIGVRILSFCERIFGKFDSTGYVATDAASQSLKEVQGILQRSNFAENIALARVSNLYFHYGGEAWLEEMARRAYRFSLKSDAALASISEPGPLLLSFEIARDPIHITVVGERGSPATESLWATALKIPDFYVRTERFTREELDAVGAEKGSLGGIKFPRLGKPAAFICANKTCSLPLFSAGELRERIFEVMRRQKTGE